LQNDSPSPQFRMQRMGLAALLQSNGQMSLTPDERHKLLVCQSRPVEHEAAFVHDGEVSEELIIHEPVETAFAIYPYGPGVFERAL
jgi:hypothetical protein